MRTLIAILSFICFASYGQQVNPPGGSGNATSNSLFNGLVQAKVGVKTGTDTAKARALWNKFPAPAILDTGTLIVQNGLLFYFTGASWETPASATGGVSFITFIPPLTGGTISTSGSVSLPQANGSQDGYLHDTDWMTFNSKQNAIGYITENEANKAINFGVLNDVLYPSTRAVNTLLNTTIAGYMPLIDSNLLPLGYVTVTYVRNNYYPLASNPAGYLTAASIAGKLNISDTASMLSTYAKQIGLVDTASAHWAAILARMKYSDSNSVYATKYGVDTAVKNTRAWTALNFLTGNQTITLSGVVSGTGTTAITTTIGNGNITNAMLAGSIPFSKLIGTDITAVGVITAGTWQGTAVADGFIASAANWNQAYNKYAVSGTYSAGTITVTNRDASTWSITGLPTSFALSTATASTNGYLKGVAGNLSFITSIPYADISGTPASWTVTINGTPMVPATSYTITAATLTTPRSIYGNNFDGSAALGQVIASLYGGTGNGFTKFSGPATSEKTFTLPNASATILTDNAAVTVGQGGTGVGTLTAHNLLVGNGTGNMLFLAPSTSGLVPYSNGTDFIMSTPTLPLSASATSGKIIKSDGTNWVASTATYASPGSAGNFMRSDGTNWLASLISAGDVPDLSATYASISGATFTGTVRIPTINSNNQSGTTYTTVLTDAGKWVTSNNASAVTFTIPPHSSVAYPVDVYISFSNYGSGKLTAAPGAGVTINGTDANRSFVQYADGYIHQIATDSWIIGGKTSN